MSIMNNNARGRITGIPGTETTVKLYPQRLGARMRNNIIRMLENRTLTGGWSAMSSVSMHWPSRTGFSSAQTTGTAYAC